MDIRFTTSEIDPPERLAAWRELVSRVFLPMAITPLPAAADDGFAGSATGRYWPGLRVWRVSATPMAAIRSRRHIELAGCDDYLLGLHLRGAAYAEQDGRAVTLGPGDFALFDSTRPYSIGFSGAGAGGFGHLIFQLPRASLGSERQARQAIAVRVPAASAAGRLVSPYLRALASPGGEEGEAACPEPAFIDAGLDLIACALRSVTSGVAAAGTAGSPAPGSLIGALKRHALGHLTEPGLTPEAVARACYVSVRQLHRAFAREETSFGAWVREQRLRRCRDDLADRELGDRAIAEIAAGWGFGSAAHFSRAFRARFGISPIALRVAAGWREPGPAASQPGETGSAGR